MRELIAKPEITELIYQRVRVLDRYEPAQMDTFTEDATTTHEGREGMAR